MSIITYNDQTHTFEVNYGAAVIGYFTKEMVTDLNRLLKTESAYDVLKGPILRGIKSLPEPDYIQKLSTELKEICDTYK